MRARGGFAELLQTDGIEATFVAADPPRTSWLACWHPHRVLIGADTEFELAQPVDDKVRRVAVQVQRVDIADCIQPLLEIGRADPEAHDHGSPGESVLVFATAAALALQMVSQGKLQPGLSPFGIDTWRLGPFDPADLARQRQLIEATPATAHAVPSSEAEPVRVVSAGRTIENFGHAIVDAFARTAAAPLAAGHAAFAARQPVTIDSRAALDSFSALADDGRLPLITLRLTPPDDQVDSFTAALAFQSRRNPALSINASSLWNAPENLRARFRDLEAQVLVVLRRSRQLWPPIGRLLEQGRPTHLTLSDDEVDELLGPISNRLGAVGLSILIPSELFQSIDVNAVVSSAAPSALGGRSLDLASLLELRWEGSVDGRQLSDDDLGRLAESKRSIIRLQDQWVRLDADSVRRLGERKAIGASNAVAAAMGAAINVEGEYHTVEVVGPLAALGKRLQAVDSAHSLPPPAGLVGTLRPYQERGLAWLHEMDQLRLGGILADDMGLGKTVQLIALHLQRDDTKPTMVVCPASVVGNWEREFNRFAPGVTVHRYHGPNRRLPDLGDRDVVLTTYGVARRDADRLGTIEWGLAVADEAQGIKNPYSRTARALRMISSQTRFALTGTPVQNQLTDLWAILDWTTPGLLGPIERFRQDVALPIERDHDEVATEHLHRILRPFLLRRRKSDPEISPDLPPKTETDEIVPLTVEQAALYRAVVSEVMDEIANAEGISRRGLVLKLVTRLKQVCNHPVQLTADSEPLAGRSGKLARTTDLLDTIRENGDRTLIFTQYVAMGKLLERHLDDLGISHRFLHGSLPLERREQLVDEFQAGDVDVFIVSLRAGGTGLNLTAATHVIHYDRWWNPAVEDQASDRAWRIGQNRAVQIHRLICEGTIEDRIASLLSDKRQLADAVVGSGEGWISDLDDDALADLVALSTDGTEV